ncbi:hypothetical protein ABEF95_016393 [Exophiala dermatitidis]
MSSTTGAAVTTATTTTTTTTLNLKGASSSTSSSSSTPAAAGNTNGSGGTDDLDIYDEIEIEDMTYDPTLQIYHYPCPCGDRFEIAIADLRQGEDVAVCPSCSLMIRVIFEVEDLPAEEKNEG